MDLLESQKHNKKRRTSSSTIITITSTNPEEGEDVHRDGVVTATTGMEHLPCEIVHDILSRLSIASLIRFRCVCKSWFSMSKDPDLINAYLASSAQRNELCLVFHCDFPIKNQLYFADFNEENNKDKVKRIHAPFSPVMPEFDVVGSCNGLLCLSDSLYNDALYIYNPFTSEYTELPRSSRYIDQEVIFGFGFNPKTLEYKVVKIIYYRNSQNGYSRARRIVYPQSEVQVLTIGSNNSWRKLGKVSYQLLRRPSEALINGRLHWVTRPCRYKPSKRLMVSFDLDDEQFREVPKPDCGGLNRSNFHLANIRNSLSAAVYGNYGRLEIWVMKTYNVKESWVKEYNIGSYIPKRLKQNPDRDRTWKIWKDCWNGRVVRVLCMLKNGEILLEYKSRALACYDPKLGKFKDLVLQGIPNWFHTIVHVGSLNWIDTPINSWNCN